MESASSSSASHLSHTRAASPAGATSTPLAASSSALPDTSLTGFSVASSSAPSAAATPTAACVVACGKFASSADTVGTTAAPAATAEASGGSLMDAASGVASSASFSSPSRGATAFSSAVSFSPSGAGSADATAFAPSAAGSSPGSVAASASPSCLHSAAEVVAICDPVCLSQPSENIVSPLVHIGQATEDLALDARGGPAADRDARAGASLEGTSAANLTAGSEATKTAKRCAACSNKTASTTGGYEAANSGAKPRTATVPLPTIATAVEDETPMTALSSFREEATTAEESAAAVHSTSTQITPQVTDNCARRVFQELTIPSVQAAATAEYVVAAGVPDGVVRAAHVAAHAADEAANVEDIVANAAGVAAIIADVAADTAGLAANTADVAGSTADVAAHTAGKAASTPGVAAKTANVAARAADVAADTTDVTGSTADVAAHTTGVAANTVHVAGSTADLGGNPANVAPNTAGVAANEEGVAAHATDGAEKGADAADASEVSSAARSSGNADFSLVLDSAKPMNAPAAAAVGVADETRKTPDAADASPGGADDSLVSDTEQSVEAEVSASKGGATHTIGSAAKDGEVLIGADSSGAADLRHARESRSPVTVIAAAVRAADITIHAADGTEESSPHASSTAADVQLVGHPKLPMEEPAAACAADMTIDAVDPAGAAVEDASLGVGSLPLAHESERADSSAFLCATGEVRRSCEGRPAATLTCIRSAAEYSAEAPLLRCPPFLGNFTAEDEETGEEKATAAAAAEARHPTATVGGHCTSEASQQSAATSHPAHDGTFPQEGAFECAEERPLSKNTAARDGKKTNASSCKRVTAPENADTQVAADTGMSATPSRAPAVATTRPAASCSEEADATAGIASAAAMAARGKDGFLGAVRHVSSAATAAFAPSAREMELACVADACAPLYFPPSLVSPPPVLPLLLPSVLLSWQQPQAESRTACVPQHQQQQQAAESQQRGASPHHRQQDPVGYIPQQFYGAEYIAFPPQLYCGFPSDSSWAAARNTLLGASASVATAAAYFSGTLSPGAAAESSAEGGPPLSNQQQTERQRNRVDRGFEPSLSDGAFKDQPPDLSVRGIQTEVQHRPHRRSHFSDTSSPQTHSQSSASSPQLLHADSAAPALIASIPHQSAALPYAVTGAHHNIDTWEKGAAPSGLPEDEQQLQQSQQEQERHFRGRSRARGRRVAASSADVRQHSRDDEPISANKQQARDEEARGQRGKPQAGGTIRTDRDRSEEEGELDFEGEDETGAAGDRKKEVSDSLHQTETLVRNWLNEVRQELRARYTELLEGEHGSAALPLQPSDETNSEAASFADFAALVMAEASAAVRRRRVSASATPSPPFFATPEGARPSRREAAQRAARAPAAVPSEIHRSLLRQDAAIAAAACAVPTARDAAIAYVASRRSAAPRFFSWGSSSSSSSSCPNSTHSAPCEWASALGTSATALLSCRGSRGSSSTQRSGRESESRDKQQASDSTSNDKTAAEVVREEDRKNVAEKETTITTTEEERKNVARNTVATTTEEGEGKMTRTKVAASSDCRVNRLACEEESMHGVSAAGRPSTSVAASAAAGHVTDEGTKFADNIPAAADDGATGTAAASWTPASVGDGTAESEDVVDHRSQQREEDALSKVERKPSFMREREDLGVRFADDAAVNRGDATAYDRQRDEAACSEINNRSSCMRKRKVFAVRSADGGTKKGEDAVHRSGQQQDEAPSLKVEREGHSPSNGTTKIVAVRFIPLEEYLPSTGLRCTYARSLAQVYAQQLELWQRFAAQLMLQLQISQLTPSSAGHAVSLSASCGGAAASPSHAAVAARHLQQPSVSSVPRAASMHAGSRHAAGPSAREMDERLMLSGQLQHDAAARYRTATAAAADGSSQQQGQLPAKSVGSSGVPGAEETSGRQHHSRRSGSPAGSRIRHRSSSSTQQRQQEVESTAGARTGAATHSRSVDRRAPTTDRHVVRFRSLEREPSRHAQAAGRRHARDASALIEEELTAREVELDDRAASGDAPGEDAEGEEPAWQQYNVGLLVRLLLLLFLFDASKEVYLATLVFGLLYMGGIFDPVITWFQNTSHRQPLEVCFPQQVHSAESIQAPTRAFKARGSAGADGFGSAAAADAAGTRLCCWACCKLSQAGRLVILSFTVVPLIVLFVFCLCVVVEQTLARLRRRRERRPLRRLQRQQRLLRAATMLNDEGRGAGAVESPTANSGGTLQRGGGQGTAAAEIKDQSNTSREEHVETAAAAEGGGVRPPAADAAEAASTTQEPTTREVAAGILGGHDAVGGGADDRERVPQNTDEKSVGGVLEDMATAGNTAVRTAALLKKDEMQQGQQQETLCYAGTTMNFETQGSKEDLRIFSCKKKETSKGEQHASNTEVAENNRRASADGRTHLCGRQDRKEETSRGRSEGETSSDIQPTEQTRSGRPSRREAELTQNSRANKAATAVECPGAAPSGTLVEAKDVIRKDAETNRANTLTGGELPPQTSQGHDNSLTTAEQNARRENGSQGGRSVPSNADVVAGDCLCGSTSRSACGTSVEGRSSFSGGARASGSSVMAGEAVITGQVQERRPRHHRHRRHVDHRRSRERRRQAERRSYLERVFYEGVLMFFLTFVPSWNPNPRYLRDFEEEDEDDEEAEDADDHNMPANANEDAFAVLREAGFEM